MVLGIAAALVAVIAAGAALSLTAVVRGRDAVERARSQVELLDAQRADLAARITVGGEQGGAPLSERLAALEGDVAAARRVHEDAVQRYRTSARRARHRFGAFLSPRGRGSRA